MLDEKRLLIRRFVLVIFDALAVYLSGYMALLTRFEFSADRIEDHFLDVFMASVPFMIVVTVAVFAVCRLYSSLWKYAGAMEAVNITAGVLISSFCNLFLIMILHKEIVVPLPRSFYVYYTIYSLIFTFVIRYSYRAFRTFLRIYANRKVQRRVMIIGAGDAGNALIKEFRNSEYLNAKVVGVIDDDAKKIGNYIHGVRVVGNRNTIVRNAKELNVDEIVVAMPSASPEEIKEILYICKDTGCELKRIPGIYQLVNGEVSISRLRPVNVNDLLGREPVKVDIESIINYVSNKVVMVTGGGGSIGSELCRQIAGHNPKMLLIVDIYENSAYDIQNELKHNYPELNLVVLIASVRNTNRMDYIFKKYRPDIVYHAAAHKHVPLMEDSPNEAIKNNVLGTWKVVDAASRWHVSRFVMISTDKAVNPTNIMGASKRICEMIIQTYNRHSETEFVAVRFGNVLGSNGSVIPLFKKQIEEGGPVTVTHPDIIRYFMTIPEAVSLVLQAGAYAKGGEIFVLDMGEPVKIADLARNLIILSGHKPDEEIKIEYTGLRPGEKLYEEMLMKEEGMQDTANKLIHIGKPIDIDEEQFMKQLAELKEYVVGEPDDIREYIKKIVPTYHPEKVRNNME